MTALAAIAFVCGPAFSEEPGTARAVLVGSEVDFPPYAFVDLQGNTTGYSIDLVQAAAKEAGINIQLKAGTWAEVRSDLEEGRIDLLPFVTWSPERDKVFQFGSTHIKVYDNIFRRKRDTRMNGDEDLRGKDILVMEKDYAHDFILKAKIAKSIQVTKTLSQALILLNAGVGDVVICERVAGLHVIKELSLDKIEALPRPVAAYTRTFSFAVKEDDRELLDRFEQGLAKVRSSGEYQRIYDKWFRGVDPKLTQAERQATISWVTAAAVTFLTILSLFALYIVEKALREKSRTLDEAENSFFQILDAIPDMVLVKREDSRIVWGNRAFREYYGMSDEELRNIIDASFSPPDVTQQYVNDDLWVFTHGKLLDIPEEPVTRHDGTIRIFHTVKAPIFDSSGRVRWTVGVSREITERLEQERVITEQRLRMMAATKMSSLGEMAAGIAHEINNPLAIISGKAEQMERMAQSGAVDTARLQDSSVKIHATAHRIAAIVKALRSFARDGSMDPFTHESVSQIVTETLELCQQRFKNHNVAIQVDGDFQNLSIECRSVQVSQILLNLLNNAFDAVSPLAERWIQLHVEDEGDFVKFSVTDSGRGIPEPVRAKIMQPFFTTKELGKGTGLGLSLSKGLAESHNGTLLLDAECGNTRFVLRLPKVQNSAELRAAA